MFSKLKDLVDLRCDDYTVYNEIQKTWYFGIQDISDGNEDSKN